MADEMANTNSEPTSRTFESTAAGTADPSQANTPAPSGGGGRVPAQEAAQPSADTQAPASSGAAEAAPPASSSQASAAETGSAAANPPNEAGNPPSGSGAGAPTTAENSGPSGTGSSETGGTEGTGSGGQGPAMAGTDMGDMISPLVATVGQTAGTIGSGGPLLTSLNGNGLVSGLGLDSLGESLGANDLGQLVSDPVSGVGQVAGIATADGGINDVVSGLATDAGTLVDSALDDLNGVVQATGTIDSGEALLDSLGLSIPGGTPSTNELGGLVSDLGDTAVS